MNEQNPINQTQFSFEEPIFENTQVYVDESKPRELEVDTTDPVINEFSYPIDGRIVNFFFNITETNFDEIEYYDRTDNNPRWRQLCSRLKNGICEKRKAFRRGHHNIDISVLDEAGNAVGQNIEFDID